MSDVAVEMEKDWNREYRKLSVTQKEMVMDFVGYMEDYIVYSRHHRKEASRGYLGALLEKNNLTGDDLNALLLLDIELAGEESDIDNFAIIKVMIKEASRDEWVLDLEQLDKEMDEEVADLVKYYVKKAV